MTAPQAPWHGVLVATALPMHDRGGKMLEIDFDGFADHVRWLAENGCHGVTPNGSLGEYHNLTPEERARVVTTAIDGADESRRWAEQAAEAGAPAVMLLPPNAYQADRRAVVGHYREVAKVGVPIVAYNNPFDTKVDLVPDLLAELFNEGLIVGAKEFSGDVRRYYETKELAPALDIMAGTDDLALEFAIAGSPGWISGYPNALPRACVQLWEEASAGKLDSARELYKKLHPLLRWDSRTQFVQAIKLSMDVVGRYGGPSRPPRVPLNEQQDKAVREATEKVIAEGLA
jgi:1-pyrroline-4-hydroxy-2-carboxylate deaminase